MLAQLFSTFLLASSLIPVEPTTFIVHTEGISKKKLTKAFQLASASTAHTIFYRFAKPNEAANLVIKKDCFKPKFLGNLAYAIPVSINGKVIGGKIVLGCDKQSDHLITILHELGHINGFMHKQDIYLDKHGIVLK